MKILHATHQDQSAGVIGEKELVFEANAVAFYGQISGLAKDKIGYPIRELSTNMWDATKEKYGNDDVAAEFLPIIKLPTRINPMISFRDFGNGMSAEAMDKVYGVIYASTKRESSTQVGGWGLGRLSPFAYLLGENGSGAYNIISINGGTKRAYTMSLSSSGKPVLRLLAEVATNEPSGMEISFAVRQEDISLFAQRAREILWSFNPRPRIEPEVHWSEPETNMSGTGWTKYNGTTVLFDGPMVRMGCVMYPFDLDQIEYAGLLTPNDTVVFEAPIGSLSVNLSREQLGYDERTKRTLRELVAHFDTELVAQVTSEIAQAKSFFQACAMFFARSDSIGAHRLAAIMPQVQWNGHQIYDNRPSDETFKFMRLRAGWALSEDFQFERAVMYPRNNVGATVVVEHNPWMSKKRLEAAGVVGKDVLWVRCKRDQLDQLGLLIGDAEYIVLDDFKVEYDLPGSKDKTKKVRMRRVIVAEGASLTHKSMAVDLLAGGMKLAKGFHGRSWRGKSYTFGVANDSANIIYEDDMRNLLADAIRREIIPSGTIFLMETENDKLDDSWVYPRDIVLAGYQQLFDPMKISDLHGVSSGSFDHRMTRLLGRDYIGYLMPEYRAIKADMDALNERIRLAARADTEQVAIKNWMRMLGQDQVAQRPAQPDPVGELNTRFRNLLRGDPVLYVLLDQMNSWRTDYSSISHYFRMKEEIANTRALLNETTNRLASAETLLQQHKERKAA